MNPQNICILGATGSIGLSTIDVALRHPDRFRVVTLTANQRMEKLAELVVRTQAKRVVVPDANRAEQFKVHMGAADLPEIRVGTQALIDVASDDQTDVVMAAIVGAAGLPAALAAAQSGKRILLANKEALVAAGSIFMQAVRENGAVLLPIDSEHNAIFQCMPEGGKHSVGNGPARGVNKIVLTASGGPFRLRALDTMHAITPEQACAHPNWSMGRKISVDSATMVNKGLEVIEAHWLFSMPADKIDVVIHPQSVIHSLVEYDDGSMLAQLGNPDMRTPIAHAMGFPERISGGVGWLDLIKVGSLNFEPVDACRYPCLGLAYEALRQGQGACIAFNAANEVAVDAFLQQQLRYDQISQVLVHVLNWLGSTRSQAITGLEHVLGLDQQARAVASAYSRTLA